MAKKKHAVITPDYDAIRPTLDTGDIVLFGGKGALSQGIKWFTNSSWSHVGMVVRLEDWGIFLWESTTLVDVADWETAAINKGVQLVVLRAYPKMPAARNVIQAQAKWRKAI